MQNLLKNILNQNPSVIGLGEMGHGIHGQCIGEVLEGLNKPDGIFLEIPIDFQSSVDNYLQTGKFDQHFEDLLLGAIKEGKDFRETFSVILNYAKKNKIPAVCVDSSKEKDEIYTQKSKYSSSYLKGKSRDEDMCSNIIEVLNKNHGLWCFIAHAAHLDYSLDVIQGDSSVGKKLKEKLGNKYFNICLLKIPAIDTTIAFLNNPPIDQELENILIKNKYSFLLQDHHFKGFDSAIIYP